MKKDISEIIKTALKAAHAAGELKTQESALPAFTVDQSKKEEFGDFSTNVAMLLTKHEGKPPRDIAALISKRISEDENVERTEVAGPGFINIFLDSAYWVRLLGRILSSGAEYGSSTVGKGKRVQVEFVSANPTGPLHIGHGRGAAVGDALARVLKAAGYEVTKEFYINDAGRQVFNLGESIQLRMQELQGKKIELGENHYKGDYIIDIAKDYIEALKKGGGGAVPTATEFGISAMIKWIEEDLKEFGIEFDEWFSEGSLDDEGLVTKTIEELKSKELVYEKDGATWFRTEKFGDDKDRVLIKADGERTYFASDIAYHRDKMARGFDTLVNVWGADHHGYEARVRALFRALGLDDSALKVIFIQLVALLRGGVPVAMGKRSGEFVTLRHVIDEVGSDACRFFFLMRKSDAQLDFDLELAKSQASENPVYYVQYCNARVLSIFAHAKEKGVKIPEDSELAGLADKFGAEEIRLIRHLGRFEEVIERSAKEMEPHRVTFYLMELAGLFHPYYNRNRVVTNDPGTTKARLLLFKAVGTVASNGLKLLGVSTPEKM
ncbi:MAG: arginine--tRNA ligase [Proteobacteria bacterium]|nr:arginine--tRNA ligase [Pseudomonadota bacterium]